MKKTFIGMMTIVILLSLAGCGTSSKPAGDLPAGGSGTPSAEETGNDNIGAEDTSGGVVFENEYIVLSFLKTESSENYEGSGENYFAMVFDVQNLSDETLSLYTDEHVFNDTYVSGVGGRILAGHEENQMKVFSRDFTLNDGADTIESVRFRIQATNNVLQNEDGTYSSSLNSDDALFLQPLMITVTGEVLNPEDHPIEPADIEIEFDPLRAGAPIDSGPCGKSANWTMYEDGTMVISGTGDIGPYAGLTFGERDEYGDYQDYRDQVVTLIIEDGVTNITAAAFDYFPALRNIKIASSVISIGNKAFNSCWNMNFMTLDIPDGVTTIGDGAFFVCEGLIEVNIPSSVSSIGMSAFEYCKSLRSVNIQGNIDTISFGTFARCEDLEQVYIPSSVTTIEEGAFLGCNNLTDVYFGGSEAEWNAISIAKMEARVLEDMGYSSEDDECLTRATIHYNSTMP